MSSLGTLAVLPLEVRTNIYTQLFRSTTVLLNLRTGLSFVEDGEEPEPRKQCPLNKGFAILAVSKQFHAEASPLVTGHINVSLTNCFPPSDVECNAKECSRLNPNAARIEHVVVSVGKLGHLSNHDFRLGSSLSTEQMFPALRSMTVVVDHSSPYRKSIWDMIACGHDMTKTPVGSSWKAKLKRGYGAYGPLLASLHAFMDRRREGLGHHVRLYLEMALTSRKACRWEIRNDWEVRTEIVKRKDMVDS